MHFQGRIRPDILKDSDFIDLNAVLKWKSFLGRLALVIAANKRLLPKYKCPEGLFGDEKLLKILSGQEEKAGLHARGRCISGDETAHKDNNLKNKKQQQKLMVSFIHADLPLTFTQQLYSPAPIQSLR